MLVHVGLELLEAHPERAPRVAGAFGSSVVVGQVSQPFECPTRRLVLMLHHRHRSRTTRSLPAPDEREEDLFLLHHVGVQLRLQFDERREELGQHVGHLVAVSAIHLPCHELEPGEFLAQGTVIRGDDMVDEVAQLRAVPTH